MTRASFVRSCCTALVMTAIIALVVIAPADVLEASCWECKYKFISGGDFLDDIYFNYCGMHQGSGAWDCYLYGDDCIEYGACEDFISV